MIANITKASKASPPMTPPTIALTLLEPELDVFGVAIEVVEEVVDAEAGVTG